MTGPQTMSGLSPRGRGNPHSGSKTETVAGSIPAWAGEPSQGLRPGDVTAVYPRVGGGTPQAIPETRMVSGLSPRGRGNPEARPSTRRTPGSIPAWAGEPPGVSACKRGVQVYPRVGGGTLKMKDSDPEALGLSPRGRGNPWNPQRRRPPRGSIPAWAGEPQGRTYRPHATGVYPRVGGGTHNLKDLRLPLGGLSPRGRGNLVGSATIAPPTGSIPAWAGEPVSRESSRVERGSIPAWAGEPFC